MAYNLPDFNITPENDNPDSSGTFSKYMSTPPTFGGADSGPIPGATYSPSQAGFGSYNQPDMGQTGNNQPDMGQTGNLAIGSSPLATPSTPSLGEDALKDGPGIISSLVGGASPLGLGLQAAQIPLQIANAIEGTHEQRQANREAQAQLQYEHGQQDTQNKEWQTQNAQQAGDYTQNATNNLLDRYGKYMSRIGL